MDDDARLQVVQQKAMLRLAAAARMPVTRLFGRAPAGLNATGESDTVNWHERVGAYQRDILKPRLDRLVQMVARSLGLAEPEAWAVKFPSLQQESEKDKAETRHLVAKTDHIYVTDGVHRPEEVAIARAAGELFELQDQMAATVNTIRNGTPISCTGEDGKWSVAMCLAAQRSIEKGRPVAMKEIC